MYVATAVLLNILVFVLVLKVNVLVLRQVEESYLSFGLHVTCLGLEEAYLGLGFGLHGTFLGLEE